MRGGRGGLCINMEGGRFVCAGGGAGCGVDGFRRGGLFWALLLAIIHLSLGDRLINVAFLQLTSKVTEIVGTQPLLFATAPEEGNGHIICSPRGFSPVSPLFPLSVLHWNLWLSLHRSPWSDLAFEVQSLNPCLFLFSPTWIFGSPLTSAIWNAIKSRKMEGISCCCMEREREGESPARGY